MWSVGSDKRQLFPPLPSIYPRLTFPLPPYFAPLVHSTPKIVAGDPNRLGPVDGEIPMTKMDDAKTSIIDGIQSFPMKARTDGEKLGSLMNNFQNTTEIKWLTIPTQLETLRLGSPPVQIEDHIGLRSASDNCLKEPFSVVQQFYYAQKHAMLALKIAFPHIEKFLDEYRYM